MSLAGCGRFHATMMFQVIDCDPATNDGHHPLRVTTLGYNFKIGDPHRRCSCMPSVLTRASARWRSARVRLAKVSGSLRRGDGGCGDPAIGQPRPERLLPGGVAHIDEEAFRAFRVVAEQQHQPGETGLAGHLELQFRVGQLRAVPHRRAVLR
ncbi:MAG: hypothetical protein ACRDQ9_12060 [Pseudonocardiaceae bacterium]